LHRIAGSSVVPAKALRMHASTLKQPTLVRIWRGRTPRDRADAYEADHDEAGIKPLINRALGVQPCREGREHDTACMTLSSWERRPCASARVAIPQRFLVSNGTTHA
jgi:hypothetical protein